MKKNSISIKDIAKLANVSTATVSRVIHNNGRFSMETKDRVEKIINEHNYKPNIIAQGLRTNTTRIIAIIVPDISNEFFSIIVSVIQKIAFENNYTCAVFNTNETLELEIQSLNSIKSLNVSGIISFNGKFDLSEKFNNVPIVYVDRDSLNFKKNNNCIFITADHEEGGYLAGQKLAEDGCKKVACITALKDADATKIRTKGFKKACSDYGMKIVKIFNPNNITHTDGYIITNDMITSGIKVDGIFCETDWLAVGCCQALIDNNISVPNDCEVIGYDGIRVTESVNPTITTIKQPKTKIGEEAIYSLLSLIRNEPIENREIKLKTELITRRSTR